MQAMQTQAFRVVGSRANFVAPARSLSSQVTPAVLRKQFATRATGKDTELADKKDLQKDIIFKPFDEVDFSIGVAHFGMVSKAAQSHLGLPLQVKDELSLVEQADMNGAPLEDSFARVGYTQDSEYAVNEQINIEYNMSYVYHAMSAYFDRDNVALPGLASYFRAASLEERTHATTLMDFQAVRGGRTKLAHLTAPQSNYQNEEKGDALHAMELALSLEKLNFHKLRELHDVADASEDAQMADFVEDMLAEQAKGVKVVADYVAQLRRIGKGHGVFHFDQMMAEDASKLATPSTQY